MPDYHFESLALDTGAKLVAGVDEAGRGPLAGPVTAAAVILDINNVPPGLDDSKRLSRARREDLYPVILSCADVSVASASVAEIDDINILQAALLAMRRALAGLKQVPQHALIDGNRLPENLCCDARSIVKGDALSLSIAAASIVAKVSRDRLMVDLAQQFPGYGWDHNAGYGTKAHFEGLRRLGVTPHHRHSFKPIHNILYQEN